MTGLLLCGEQGILLEYLLLDKTGPDKYESYQLCVSKFRNSNL